MASNSFNKIKGLTTFFNSISTSPEGSQVIASNVVIDRDNIIEPRRGMKVLTEIPEQAKQLLSYKSQILTHYDNNIGFLDTKDPATLTTFKGSANISLESSSSIITIVDHGLKSDDVIYFNQTRNFSITNSISYFPFPSGINQYTDYIVYNVISKDQFEIALSLSNAAIVLGAGNATAIFDYVLDEVKPRLRVKSVELNGSLFVTAADGIKKITRLNAFNISDAGGITALNSSLSLDFASSVGFFGPQNPAPLDVEVAYRVVWGTKDLNKVLILGKASERAVIINTTRLNATVNITFPVPQGITTEYFYQIYRTNVYNIGGSGDEMRLVLEAPYDGYASVLTINDATPESIRDSGTPLYSNELSGTGVLQSNDRPPVCEDITTYKNRAWFANTKTTQKLDLTFLGFDNLQPVLTTSLVGGTLSTTTLTVGVHGLSVGDYVAVITPNDVVTGEGQFLLTGVTATTITFASNSTFYTTNTLVYRSYIKTIKNSQVNRYFFVGRPEITKITHPVFPLSNFNVGDYFNLTSIEDKIKYYFWFAKTGTNQDPLPYGNTRVGIRINLYKVDTLGAEVPVSSTAEISDAIVDTINSTSDFLAINTGMTTTGNITVATITSGMVTDPVSATKSGSSITSITKFQDGFGENVNLGFVRLSSYVSPAAAIEDTAKSLVNVINFTQTSPVYAYYLTTNISLPGQLYLEEKNFSQTPFSIFANNADVGALFSPTLSSTIKTSSTNNVGNNILMFSKEQQPEAVPVVNSFRIGPQDKAIKRILALRDSLFIFKEEGIYRLTGENEANFNVALFDNSATIIAPDSAVVLNNQIHCLTTQGVSTVSETGVGVISRVIENIFNQISTEDYVNAATATFGIGYEADRAYIIFIPKDLTDLTAKIAYRYNSFTQTWTSFDKSAVCGLVSTNNKLYLGCDDINAIEVERKKLNSRDYVDRDYARTTSAFQQNRVYLDNASAMEVGDTLTQKQYLTVGEFNDLVMRLKLDPQLGFSQTFDLLPTIGGADFTDSMRDLVIELNTKDNMRRFKIINLTSDIDTSTDTITHLLHGFEENDIISISTSGTLPAPLTVLDNYRVVNVTTNTFQLTSLIPINLVKNSALGLGTFTQGLTSLTFNLVRDIDYINSRIVFPDHQLAENSIVTFTSAGTLPSGLISGRQYKIVNVTPNAFQINEVTLNLSGPHSGSATFTQVYFYSGTNDNLTLQKEYNDIASSLNASDGVFFANFETSESFEELDLYIKSVNYSQNFVTLDTPGPFYVGDINHYKSIKSEVEWNSFNLGNPSIMKHVRSSTVMVENNSLNKLEIGFASELSGNFENVTFTLNGSGVYGKSKFGSTAFGGNGTQYSTRTLIPRQKQRCRMIAIRIFHYSAFFKFSILGVSFDYETTSERSSRS